MKKKIIISIVIIFLIIFTFLNYKRIKGFLLYGVETCNGNCSSISEEQLNVMGIALLKCPICSRENQAIPDMIICYKCASSTGRCTKCGNIVKNSVIHDDYGVLVEKSYANYAWGKVYNGTVICNNGEIYEFDGELDKVDVLKSQNTKKKIKTVSESDLRLIKEYITSIEEKYEEKSVGCDMGSSSISIYSNDKRIVLSETGDWERNNTSKYTRELLQIISKYL